MRRKDKEIRDRQQVDSIIEKAIVCRLGLSENDRPYIVPLCFGYDGNSIYFHSAPEGRKLDILRENDKVCFEIEGDFDVVESGEACDWTIRYRSVIGSGKAHIVEEKDSIRRALDIIMKHYSDKSFEYPDKTIEKTAVIRVDIESVTGKSSGYE